MTTGTGLIPDGLTVRRIMLDSSTGPFDWWRLEDKRGSIIGSGFSRDEAIDCAWREMVRRTLLAD